MDEDPLGGELKDRGYRGLVCRGRVRALDRHILLVPLTTLPVDKHGTARRGAWLEDSQSSVL